MDNLIVNKNSYQITDNPAEISIELAQKIAELIPKDSYYRNTKKEFVYNHDLCLKLLNIVSGLPNNILKDCINVRRIYFKFIHSLVYYIFNPYLMPVNLRKWTIKENIYEDEEIQPFAEACDLLAMGDSIGTAEYLCSIYLRKKKERYNEKKSKERAESFKYLTYQTYIYVLNKHNEAAETIRKYHSKIFQGDGEGKGMNALISQVAAKGIFNNAKLSPLESVRRIKVNEFFDYIETTI